MSVPIAYLARRAGDAPRGLVGLLALIALCSLAGFPSRAAAQSLGGGPGTGSGGAVALKRAVVILTDADSEAGQIQLMEKLVLQNDGDVPYQPGRWEESVVRLSLPAGAQSIAVEAGPDGARLVPASPAGTYALAAPLPTGEQTFVLSYTLPYQGTALRLARAVAMPVGALQILAPEVPGLELRAAGTAVAAGEPLVMGTQRYLLLEGRQLPAGADVSFELRGLPPASAPAVVRSAASPTMDALPAMPLLVAVTVVLAGALGYGALRAPATAGAAAAGEPRGVGEAGGAGGASAGNALRALRRLEAEHEAGALPDDEYRVARWRLKARAAQAARLGVPVGGVR